ncbi:hypothetical protein, partial [Amphritea pacifica]|uniref:hypothetical protein n=1 Tax=Amphritea pacifica TaxID=2811233 RepID=UPI00196556A5
DTAVKRMFVGVKSHRSSPFGLVAFQLSVKTVSWGRRLYEYQSQALGQNFRYAPILPVLWALRLSDKSLSPWPAGPTPGTID